MQYVRLWFNRSEGPIASWRKIDRIARTMNTTAKRLSKLKRFVSYAAKQIKPNGNAPGAKNQRQHPRNRITHHPASSGFHVPLIYSSVGYDPHKKLTPARKYGEWPNGKKNRRQALLNPQALPVGHITARAKNCNHNGPKRSYWFKYLTREPRKPLNDE